MRMEDIRSTSTMQVKLFLTSGKITRWFRRMVVACFNVQSMLGSTLCIVHDSSHTRLEVSLIRCLFADIEPRINLERL